MVRGNTCWLAGWKSGGKSGGGYPLMLTMGVPTPPPPGTWTKHIMLVGRQVALVHVALAISPWRDGSHVVSSSTARCFSHTSAMWKCDKEPFHALQTLSKYQQWVLSEVNIDFYEQLYQLIYTGGLNSLLLRQDISSKSSNPGALIFLCVTTLIHWIWI